jgi:hypothetical protein
VLKRGMRSAFEGQKGWEDFSLHQEVNKNGLHLCFRQLCAGAAPPLHLSEGPCVYQFLVYLACPFLCADPCARKDVRICLKPHVLHTYGQIVHNSLSSLY